MTTRVLDIKFHPTNRISFGASWDDSKAHDFIGKWQGVSIWRSGDGGNTWKKAVEGFQKRLSLQEESA